MVVVPGVAPAAATADAERLPHAVATKAAQVNALCECKRCVLLQVLLRLDPLLLASRPLLVLSPLECDAYILHRGKRCRRHVCVRITHTATATPAYQPSPWIASRLPVFQDVLQRPVFLECPWLHLWARTLATRTFRHAFGEGRQYFADTSNFFERSDHSGLG
jgi:hypothetical protein